jgi:hypothetical protein
MCVDSDKTLRYQIEHGEILMNLPPPHLSSDELPIAKYEALHSDNTDLDVLGELESQEKDKRISKRKRYKKSHTEVLQNMEAVA